mgnify:CR=1 FL=1|tara:strand:+ start:984 stop:1229 length:246 start_codon:yes stop_codon:yes gene_type:complete
MPYPLHKQEINEEAEPMAQTSTYKGNLTKIDKMKELSASGRERDADPMKKLIALQKMTNQLLIELLDEQRGSNTTETEKDA